MPEAPDPDTGGATPPPRTWMPLAAAGGVAFLVVAGAFLVSALGSGMSAGENDAVRACEAAYAASGETGDIPAAIVAGDVYASAEWRDLLAWEREQGYVPDGEAEPTAAEAAERDDAAAALAEAGRDVVTVVWWLESEEHWGCIVAVEGDVARDETAAVGPWGVGGLQGL